MKIWAWSQSWVYSVSLPSQNLSCFLPLSRGGCEINKKTGTMCTTSVFIFFMNLSLASKYCLKELFQLAYERTE